MQSIFFSYGHDEYSFIVIKIKDYLEAKGYSIYIDTELLRVGDDWEHQLEQAITNQEKFLFFITPHSARRPDGYCLNEIAMALYHNKDIIPAMLNFQIPPLSIVRIQYIDLQDLVTKKDNQTLFETKMKEIEAYLNGERSLDFDALQSNVLKNLSPIDFSQDFAKHSEIIGREWVLDAIDNAIKENPNKNAFWITAEAGYGKSAIATYLANTHKDVIGIHYCNYNYENKKNAINVVKTMAFHLQSQIPEYADRIKNLDFRAQNAYELFELLILNPFKKIDTNRDYILIIDALDEAYTGNENEIADLIQDEFHKLPKNVKVLITSRADKKLVQKLSNLDLISFNVSSENNKADCKLYIKQKISELEFNEDIKIESFIEKLLTQSNSNILYLKHFFNNLGSKKINLNSLKQFPKSLNGVYERFFKRICKSEDEYYDNIAPIFELMLAYKEAIPKKIIQEVFDIDKISLKRTLNKIGSMIKEADDNIMFYHKSMMDWLVMDENTLYQISETKGIKNLNNYFNKFEYQNYHLDYSQFNKLLLDFYIVQNKKSEYFKKLDSLDEAEKIYKCCHDLSESYGMKHIENAIYLQEYCQKIISTEYKLNPSKWEEQKNENLSGLLYSYKMTKNNSKAKKIGTEAIESIEKLYEIDQTKWAFEYCTILNNLMSLYIENHSKAKDYLEKAKQLCEIHQKENKDKWTKAYINTLINLSYVHGKNNENQKAISLLEKTKKEIEKVDTKSFDNFDNEFIILMNNLAYRLKENNELERAKKIETTNLEFTQQKYEEDNDKWANQYFVILLNNASSFKKIKDFNKASELQIIAKKIAKQQYKNQNFWAKNYSKSLVTLALTYKALDKTIEAIYLELEALEIIEPEYLVNPENWHKNYLKTLNNLAESYRLIKDEHKLFEIEQKIKKINENHE